MTTKRQRVHNALIRAARESRGVGEKAWVCARTLMHPQVGGNRWSARLWELREEGLLVDKRDVCVCDQCRFFRQKARSRGETPSRLTAWRLHHWSEFAREAA